MQTGKVLKLYMTMSDMMRLGNRISCEDIDCDPDGIIGDMNYETAQKRVMLLTSQISYDLAQEAEIVISEGVLMENIHVDIDLYDLAVGDVIEIGETLLEVTERCELYGYLYSLAPELPEIIQGKRGLFVRPLDYGQICLGDEVIVHKKNK